MRPRPDPRRNLSRHLRSEDADMIRLNKGTYSVSGPNGQTRQLTKQEFQLADLLVSASGSIVEHRAIFGTIFRSEFLADPYNSVRQVVSRLKKKLTDVGLFDPIVRIHGVGYRLNIEPAPTEILAPEFDLPSALARLIETHHDRVLCSQIISALSSRVAPGDSASRPPQHGAAVERQ